MNSYKDCVSKAYNDFLTATKHLYKPRKYIAGGAVGGAATGLGALAAAYATLTATGFGIAVAAGAATVEVGQYTSDLLSEGDAADDFQETSANCGKDSPLGKQHYSTLLSKAVGSGRTGQADTFRYRKNIYKQLGLPFYLGRHLTFEIDFRKEPTKK